METPPYGLVDDDDVACNDDGDDGVDDGDDEPFWGGVYPSPYPVSAFSIHIDKNNCSVGVPVWSARQSCQRNSAYILKPSYILA